MRLESRNDIKKAVIVSLWNENNDLYFEEMEELLANIGYKVEDTIVQKMPRPDRKFYVGPGKALEIKNYVESSDIDVIVFDDEAALFNVVRTTKILKEYKQQYGIDIEDKKVRVTLFEYILRQNLKYS